MDGIIPVWKERGMTSHDVVFKVRKILKMKKVGHTGTLDPNVDGVLPICVGKGTKLVDLIMDKKKEYIGEITLGFATDTEDLDGEVVERVPVEAPVADDQIDQMMTKLTGTITQIPPMYSAVKVKGKRLYEYARAGEKVERPQRQIQVDLFERTSAVISNEEEKTQSFRFRVICGKGTYVRTLAYDLGKLLGFPATMTDLTRTGSTPYQAADCVTLKQLEEMVAADDFSFLDTIENAVSYLPAWQVPIELAQLVANGAVLSKQQLPDELQQSLPIRVYLGDQLKAIYDAHPSKNELIKPSKMF